MCALSFWIVTYFFHDIRLFVHRDWNKRLHSDLGMYQTIEWNVHIRQCFKTDFTQLTLFYDIFQKTMRPCWPLNPWYQTQFQHIILYRRCFCQFYPQISLHFQNKSYISLFERPDHNFLLDKNSAILAIVVPLPRL